MNYYARSKYQLLIFLRERQIIKHFFFLTELHKKFIANLIKTLWQEVCQRRTKVSQNQCVSTLDIAGWIILLSFHLVHCRVFSSIPGFYS